MTRGGYVQVESGIPYASVRALEQRGHDVHAGNGGFGGYQAIRWDGVNHVYHGASESRKDGCAIGYQGLGCQPMHVLPTNTRGFVADYVRR